MFAYILDTSLHSYLPALRARDQPTARFAGRDAAQLEPREHAAPPRPAVLDAPPMPGDLSELPDPELPHAHKRRQTTAPIEILRSINRESPGLPPG